jgi:hypothetical protein
MLPVSAVMLVKRSLLSSSFYFTPCGLKKDGDGGFADIPFGDADDEVVEVLGIAIDCYVVHGQKGQRAGKGGSLETVEEWVVPADSVQIRRSHLEERLVQKCASERCFDVAERRVKEWQIAGAGQTAELSDSIRVNPASEKVALSLSEPPEHSAVARVDLIHDLLEFAPPGVLSDRRDNQHIAARRDLDIGTLFEPELFEQWLVEHESHAVSGPRELLFHGQYIMHKPYVRGVARSRGNIDTKFTVKMVSMFTGDR